MDRIAKAILQLSDVPTDETAFQEWLRYGDALSFLARNSRDVEFVLEASIHHLLFQTVIAPSADLDDAHAEELTHWECHSWSGWGISYGFSEPGNIEIVPPLRSAHPDPLNAGEQLTFVRSFSGRQTDNTYIELLQRFAHSFELHYVPEREAYCRLDRHGDVEDVVKITIVQDGHGEHRGRIITVLREVLDQYMAITDAMAVRMFDLTRYRDPFPGWDRDRKETFEREAGVQYRLNIQSNASYLRGAQIVRSEIPKDRVVASLRDETIGEGSQYAEFIAEDWRHKKIDVISCAPGATANYFQKSDLPFEITPAFFRPEVLLKYKANREKYQLGQRSVSCRGAWTLKTFDVNAAGQVHTYLVYLRDLPYEEQLHWKQYNEAPKAPISDQAYTTDMKGEVWTEYNALSSLKRALDALTEKRVSWWRLKSGDLADRALYPLTTSPDEWSDEILTLDQLVVEGFVDKALRKMAVESGRQPDPQFRSLKLVEECLIGRGYEEEHAREIVAPLRELHDLRSKVKGHATGTSAPKIRAEVLKKHRTYREHYRDLCARCDEAVQRITEAFDPPRT